MTKVSALLPVLLLIAAQAAAQPVKDDGKDTIVITGTPLRETARTLKQCLARKCPPEEDIDATLAHAENLFVAGDYAEARQTTLASIRRNARHARTHPVPVSDLYRANSRIAAHLGEGEDYLRSTNNIKRALKAGLPKDDVRLIGADLEKAGMFAALGRLARARQIYAEAEDDAEALGRPDLAAAARIRQAWLHELAGDRSSARRELRKIAGERGPASAVARVTAMILLDRLDRREGKPGSPETLIRELRALGAKQPVLLFSPPLDLPPKMFGEGSAGSVTRRMPTQDLDDVWVDIGFWVTAQGRVEEVEVLRSRGATGWAAPVLKSIAGRLYSASPTASPTYRVERYSYTSFWSTGTGTRLRVRSPEPRIEYLDLTADIPPS